MPEVQVQILLSTFNGAQFLREQLDSIINQTFQDWQLLVRDDGSTDETLKIVEEYGRSNTSKIKVITGGSGGDASNSFMSMLSFTKAPYVMFCDQDDVWIPSKVETAVSAIKQLEKKNSVALYFTDMKVVNEELHELYPSFFEQQKLKPEWSKISEYTLVQSIAAGCTMIFTQDLIQRLHPIKAPLFQHDHWLLMHASYYGAVDYSKEKTVLYRQHQSNVVGSHEIDTSYFINKINSLNDIWKRWKYIKRCFGKKVTILKLMSSKWKINKQRL